MARFLVPSGVAVDGAGNVYVADFGSSDIRKITSGGVVTTLAGTAGLRGSRDATGADARFDQPNGVVVDTAGNLYVADANNNTIREVTTEGVVTTLAGTAGMSGSVDGTGGDARFDIPLGVAVDSAGNVYVADSLNCTIRKITAGGVVMTLAGAAHMLGSVDGTGGEARFARPLGVASDGAGNVYVADAGNYTIRKVTVAGVVTTLAGTAGMSGNADGTGANARFAGLGGVGLDTAGNVYVTDNHTIRKVTADGVVTTLAGAAGRSGSADATGAAARFNYPAGLASDRAGNIYVADELNSTIRMMTAGGVVTTLAGAAAVLDSVDGAGAAARFNSPFGVSTDSNGNVYIADANNDTVRKVTGAGVVTTLAGTAGRSGSVDGTGAAARFAYPLGVAVDSAGNVYVADSVNITVGDTLRKVTAAGVVTTVAGAAGMPGSVDGTGAAARFNGPEGVAVDSAGNVYVADQDSTIRKVTAGGAVSTLAGTAGVNGGADGTGAAASFNNPFGVAVDSAGNVYVADTFNSTIRKITAAGVVSTLAGAAGIADSRDGTGAAARFNHPLGVAVDRAGNVYVADTDNSTIRKITPTGTTTTIAGTAGVTGILLGATARFAAPRGLTIVGDSIVISDTNAILVLPQGAR